MYPKNNASPPIIAVGQVILIADGSVVTADAVARVKIGTGGWGASGGTLACDTTSGCWTYVPSQAETNAESFIVAVYKASCIGCQATVITTASSVAGNVQLAAAQPATTFATLTVTGATTLAAVTQTGALQLGVGSTTTFAAMAIGALTQTGAASLGVGSTVTFAATSLGNTTMGTLTQTGAASLGVGSTVTYATLGIGALTATSTNFTTKIPCTIAVGDIANNAITNAAVADDVDVNVKTITAGVTPSAADIAAACANAVWDEALGDHVGAGSASVALAAVLVDTGTDIPATLTTISGYVDVLPSSWVVPATAVEVTAVQTHGDSTWATATGFATPTNITAATGVVLASTGLDSIATTAPTGVASNFREMIVAVWRRFYKKSTLTATQLKTYDDAGTGVLTTQTVSDDSTTQTQGTSS